MTTPIRQLTTIDRVLPSRSGRVCRVLCPILVVLAGCATDEDAFDASTCGAPQSLRVNGIAIPKTNAEVRDVAIDLDRDEALDNQIGMVAAVLQQHAGVELSPLANARLASDVTWHVGVRTCGDDRAAITLAQTAEIGDVIHMTGTRNADGSITARGDGGTIPIAVLLDPSGRADAGWVSAHVGAIELVPLPDGSWRGRLGLGVDGAQVLGLAAHAWAPFFDEHGLFLSFFDKAPEDGRITVDELLRSNLMEVLFAPDLHDELGMSIATSFTAR